MTNVQLDQLFFPKQFSFSFGTLIFVCVWVGEVFSRE